MRVAFEKFGSPNGAWEAGMGTGSAMLVFGEDDDMQRTCWIAFGLDQMEDIGVIGILALVQFKAFAPYELGSRRARWWNRCCRQTAAF